MNKKSTAYAAPGVAVSQRLKKTKTVPTVAERLKMIDAYIKRNTVSVQAATRSLQRAGILDKKGHLSRRYK